MSQIDPRLEAFIGRCDRVAQAQKWSRSTLSTCLFNDGKRLKEIAAGRSDIGIRRLAAAEQELAALEGRPAKVRAA